MAIKGYLRTGVTAGELRRGIAELESAGVPEDDIVICENPEAVRERLGAGDTLVMCTVYGLGGLRRMAKLLEEVSCRGLVLRILDEGIDTSVAAPDWLTVAGTLCRIEQAHRSERSRVAVHISRQPGHKPIGRPMAEKTVRQLRKAIRLYYTTGKSVREICYGEGFDPSILYRWMNRNGLPRREEVAADPSRNPLKAKNGLKVRFGNKILTLKLNENPEKIEKVKL